MNYLITMKISGILVLAVFQYINVYNPERFGACCFCSASIHLQSFAPRSGAFWLCSAPSRFKKFATLYAPRHATLRSAPERARTERSGACYSSDQGCQTDLSKIGHFHSKIGLHLGQKIRHFIRPTIFPMKIIMNLYFVARKFSGGKKTRKFSDDFRRR